MSRAKNLANLIGGASAGTSGMALPSGTTAQRPESVITGMIRYNTTLGLGEIYTASGWNIVGAPPPTITTISPTTFNGETNTQITINGSDFTNDVSVKFITSGNVEYTASTVVYINSGQIIANTPRDFTIAEGPLTIKLIQASGIGTILSALSCGGTPVWVTAVGNIGTAYTGEPFTASVAATDPDTNATITYNVSSGYSLPAGLSLNNSTGTISGNLPAVSAQTTYTFNIDALDNAGNITARQFTIINKIVPTMILFGNNFGIQGTITSGTSLNLSSVSDLSINTSNWSNYTTNITSDSNLNNKTGHLRINDTDGSNVHLWGTQRLYLFRDSVWNSVSITGWTSYNSTNYIAAITANNSYYRDFTGNQTIVLDNNSAMYISREGTTPPIVIGKQNIDRYQGSSWFSPGYYGIEKTYQLTAGMRICAWDWVTSSTAGSARIWLFVMERDSSNQYRYYIRAGWMFTDPNVGSGLRRTMRTEDASNTVGTLIDATTKRYIVPSTNHLASGQYYIGWYSGDPNGGTQPNGNIYTTTREENAGGNGTVHYIGSSTVPSDNLGITFTSLNTGIGMIMTAYGYT